MNPIVGVSQICDFQVCTSPLLWNAGSGPGRVWETGGTGCPGFANERRLTPKARTALLPLPSPVSLLSNPTCTPTLHSIRSMLFMMVIVGREAEREAAILSHPVVLVITDVFVVLVLGVIVVADRPPPPWLQLEHGWRHGPGEIKRPCFSCVFVWNHFNAISVCWRNYWRNSECSGCIRPQYSGRFRLWPTFIIYSPLDKGYEECSSLKLTKNCTKTENCF